MHLTPPRLLGLREAKQDQQSFVDMRLESRQGSPLAQLLFKYVSSEDCESFEANEVQRQYRAWEKVELKNPDGSRSNVKLFDVVVRDKDLPISPWRGPPWNDEQGDEEIQSTGSANTEEHGRVVGRAKWEWRPASWAKGSETETKLDQQKQPEDEKRQLPEKLNKDLMHEFETKIEEQIRRHFDGKGHYYLSYLATSPSHGRRGVGATLTSWMFAKADAEQAICCLQASPKGYGLYKKLGFQEIDHLEIDMAKYGGEGIHKHVTMIRWPQPISAAKNGASAD